MSKRKTDLAITCLWCISNFEQAFCNSTLDCFYSALNSPGLLVFFPAMSSFVNRLRAALDGGTPTVTPQAETGDLPFDQPGSNLSDKRDAVTKAAEDSVICDPDGFSFDEATRGGLGRHLGFWSTYFLMYDAMHSQWTTLPGNHRHTKPPFLQHWADNRHWHFFNSVIHHPECWECRRSVDAMGSRPCTFVCGPAGLAGIRHYVPTKWWREGVSAYSRLRLTILQWDSHNLHSSTWRPRTHALDT